MIKAWALANFIVEFIVKEDGEERPATWIIWTNGSSNQQAEKAGVLLQSPKGDTTECAVQSVSNSQQPTMKRNMKRSFRVLTWLKQQGLCQ